MKQTSLILSIVSIIAAIVLAVIVLQAPKAEEASVVATESTIGEGAIVYFSMDRVLNEYNMAIDLAAVVESKANSISQEINRRGTKLENDIKKFQEKINKGLLTQSVAEQQNQKLVQDQQEFQNYTAQKQNEIAEEQAVMMNQIADAINTYVEKFNAEKKYAMILTTQGDILASPVVKAAAELDITSVLIEGLNAEYAATK